MAAIVVLITLVTCSPMVSSVMVDDDEDDDEVDNDDDNNDNEVSGDTDSLLCGFGIRKGSIPSDIAIDGYMDLKSTIAMPYFGICTPLLPLMMRPPR